MSLNYRHLTEAISLVIKKHTGGRYMGHKGQNLEDLECIQEGKYCYFTNFKGILVPSPPCCLWLLTGIPT